MKSVYLLFFGAVVLSGCGFYHEKDPGDPSSVTPPVSYAQISAEVFQRRCDLCHSLGGAGFNSSSYSAIVSKISQVGDRALVKQNMPPDSPLTPYEQKVLSTWIQGGLLNEDQTGLIKLAFGIGVFLNASSVFAFPNMIRHGYVNCVSCHQPQWRRCAQCLWKAKLRGRVEHLGK